MTVINLLNDVQREEVNGVECNFVIIMMMQQMDGVLPDDDLCAPSIGT